MRGGKGDIHDYSWLASSGQSVLARGASFTCATDHVLAAPAKMIGVAPRPREEVGSGP